MKPANAATPLQDLAEAIGAGLTHPQNLWQLAIIALAIGLAVLVARMMRARILVRLHTIELTGLRADALRFSIEGVRRLAFPVTATLLVLAGWLALRLAGMVHRPLDVQLLRIAVTLLTAMAVIRLVVYGLRRALPRAQWLGAFERAIATVLWTLVALHLFGVLHDVEEALDSVLLPLGRTRMSVWDVAVGAVSVLVAVLVALWTGAAVEARLMDATALTANSRVVLSRVFKALLLVVGVLVALSAVGIDLTVLSVFGGALGVGLGLGLQRIASSYVSGFIILLDRSLSIGDMITVDKYYGSVSQINTRYTVIKAMDGTETIVPNDMLVSQPVVNHSYTDRRVRVPLRAQVAYGSDVERALRILEECARAQPRVLADPPPAAFVTGLAGDGIDLELGFWIIDPEEGSLAIRSAIVLQLLAQLQQAGIAIPFPQRDVRIVGADGAVLGPVARPPDAGGRDPG